MKHVPFYANLEDNRHCAVAVQRSIIEYFTDQKLSWNKIEKLSGFQEGKAAWTVDIWTRLSKRGFDIKMIEPFDYRAFAKEGEAYLHRAYKPETAKWQLENTNVLEIKHIDEFLETVQPLCRRPTLADIDHMLAEKRLVFVVLNSKVLNDEPGYSDHAVLVLEEDNDDFIIHDPGLPPQPHRRVPKSKLWQAMGGDDNTVEVTGVKLRAKPMRADVLLAGMYPEYSRAALAKLFDKRAVTLGDKILKAGDKIAPGVAITADISSLEAPTPAIELPVLFENDDCVVVNKPAGVLSHSQGAFSSEASVASFLRNRMRDLEGDRAGIVHRLDRATSGVMIGAKNQKALAWLQQQFAARKVKKTYIAVVKGHLDPTEAVIDMSIERNPTAPSTFRVGVNGKTARTRYKVLEVGEKTSLVELTPETGRTHQLRVHLAKIGHPIIGDPLYGSGKHGDRLFLHALSLTITLLGGEQKTFTAPLPPEFKEQI